MTDMEERNKMLSTANAEKLEFGIMEENTTNILINPNEEMQSDSNILKKIESTGCLGDHLSKKAIATITKITINGWNSSRNDNTSDMKVKNLNSHVEELIDSTVRENGLKHLECHQENTMIQTLKRHEKSKTNITNSDLQVTSSEICKQNEDIYTKETTKIYDSLNKKKWIMPWSYHGNSRISFVNTLQEKLETEANSILGEANLKDCNRTGRDVLVSEETQSSSKSTQNFENLSTTSQIKISSSNNIPVNPIMPSNNPNDQIIEYHQSTAIEKNEMDPNVPQSFQVHDDIPLEKSTEINESPSATNSNMDVEASLSPSVIKEDISLECIPTDININKATIEHISHRYQQADMLTCSDIKYFSQPCFPTYQQNFNEEEEYDISSIDTSQETKSDYELNEDIPFPIEFLSTRDGVEETNTKETDDINNCNEEQFISENPSNDDSSKSGQLNNKTAVSDIKKYKNIHSAIHHLYLPSETFEDATDRQDISNEYLLERQDSGNQGTSDLFDDKVYESKKNNEKTDDQSTQEITSDYEINKDISITVGNVEREIYDEEKIKENNKEEKSTNNSKLLEVYNTNTISNIGHDDKFNTEKLPPEAVKNITNPKDDSNEYLSGNQSIQIQQNSSKSQEFFMKNPDEIKRRVENLALESYRNNYTEGNCAVILQDETCSLNNFPCKRTEDVIVDVSENSLHKNSSTETITDKPIVSEIGNEETAQENITKSSSEQTINETEQTINETEQTINETEQIINETEQTINETEQTINETEQTINETEQTAHSSFYDNMKNLQFPFHTSIQDLRDNCENSKYNKEAVRETENAGKQDYEDPRLQHTYNNSTKENYMTISGTVTNDEEKEEKTIKSNIGHDYESVHKSDTTGQNSSLLTDISSKDVRKTDNQIESKDREIVEENIIKGYEEYYVPEMQKNLNNIQVVSSTNPTIETYTSSFWKKNNLSDKNICDRYGNYGGKYKEYMNESEDLNCVPDILNISQELDVNNQISITKVVDNTPAMKKYSLKLNKECTETSDGECVTKIMSAQDININDREPKNAAAERQASILEDLNNNFNSELISKSSASNLENLQKDNGQSLSIQENYFHTDNNTNCIENTNLSLPRNDITYNKQSSDIRNSSLIKRITSSDREFDPALNEHAIRTSSDPMSLLYSSDDNYNGISKTTNPHYTGCDKKFRLSDIEYEDKIKESIYELFGSDISCESYSSLGNALQTTDTIVDNILDFEIDTAINKYGGTIGSSDQVGVDQSEHVQSTTVQTDITGEVNICKHSTCSNSIYDNKQCTCVCRQPTKRSIDALCLEPIYMNKKTKLDYTKLKEYEQLNSDFCMEKILEKQKQTIYFFDNEEEEGKEEREEDEFVIESSSANENGFISSDQKVPDAEVNNSWMRGENQNEMYTNDHLKPGTSKNEHLFRWNSPASLMNSSQGTNLPRKCSLRVGLSKKAKPSSLHQTTHPTQ